MKRLWNRLPSFAALFSLTAGVFAAEDLTLYHKELAKADELPGIRAASTERFETLKQNIESSRQNFKTEKLPPLVRERMTKRFEICDRLIRTIQAQSQNPQMENVFHVMRALNDLEIFERYFKDELEHGKKVQALPAAKVFSVKDFGAKGDGITDDTAAVEAALAAIRKLGGAPAELLFPKGKYRFSKLMHAESTRNLFGNKPIPCADVKKENSNNHYYTKYVHFLLTDFDNLTVRGETPDTELIFAGQEHGILLAACNNVTLKDLTLRSGLPTHTQGMLEAVDMKNKTLTLRIDPGFPTPEDSCWKVVHDCTAQSYDDKGVLVKAGSDILVIKPWTYKKLGDRLYEMNYTAARYRQIPSGIRMAFPVRQDRQSMVQPKRCKFTTFDNITIVSAGASAFPTAESYVTSFINCKILPEKGRLMSSAADGSFNADNFFGPYYRGCIFRNFGDDGINVFGYAGHLLEQKGKWIKADCHHFFGEYVAPGETLTLQKKFIVAIIDPNTGKIKGMARVVSVKSTPDNGLPVCEMELDGHLAENAIVTAKTLAPELSWIEYRKAVNEAAAKRRAQMQSGPPESKPDMIAFLHESGIGTVVTGCEFTNNRHNGITMQSSNVLIENTLLGDNSDFGILLASYYRGLGGWREGGLPYNVVIRNNTLRNTFIALSLWYSIGQGKYAPVAALRDILFENNRCIGATRGIDFYNVNGFCMRRNVMEGLKFVRCDKSNNVYMENNLWDGEAFSPAHFLAVAKGEPVKCDFRTTDPKFAGRAPELNKLKLDHYRWSKTPDSLKLQMKSEGLGVDILKRPEGEKIHAAFTQTGFLCSGLPVGNYRVKVCVTADRDCSILLVSEIVKKKEFASKRISCKANAPQETELLLNVESGHAWQPMRLCSYYLAEAEAGTHFELTRPTVEHIEKK